MEESKKTRSVTSHHETVAQGKNHNGASMQLHCNICVLICQLASLGKWTEGITSCDPGYSVVTVDKNNIVTLINKAENSSKICRMKIEYGVFDNGCDPANFDDGE